MTTISRASSNSATQATLNVGGLAKARNLLLTESVYFHIMSWTFAHLLAVLCASGDTFTEATLKGRVLGYRASQFGDAHSIGLDHVRRANTFGLATVGAVVMMRMVFMVRMLFVMGMV